MAERVHKIGDVIFCLALIIGVILADMTVAVLTEYAVLPDSVWILTIVINLVMSGVIVGIWEL